MPTPVSPLLRGLVDPSRLLTYNIDLYNNWRSLVTDPPIDGVSIVIDGNGDLSVVGWAGFVTGPASATDEAIARYDGTTGKLIQNSLVLIDDTGNVTGIVALSANSGNFNTVLTSFLGHPTAGTINIIDDLTFPTGGQISGVTFLNGIFPGDWVVGPASATDNALARYDATTGKLIQNSGAILDDSNNLTGITIEGVAPGDWVVGPASATDNAIARYDLTTGKLIQDSGVTIDDSDDVTGIRNLDITAQLNGRDPDGFIFGEPIGGLDNELLSYDGVGGVTAQGTGVIVDTGSITSGLVDITMTGDLNGRDPDDLVAGPASAVDENYAVFDGTGGKTIKDSGVALTAVPVWYKINLDEATGPWDFPFGIPLGFNQATLDAAAGLLTAPFYVHAIKLKHSAAWNGGTISAAKMTVTLSTGFVTVGLDVFASPTGARLMEYNFGAVNVSSSPIVTITPTGGNINQFDGGGDADIWVLASQEE